MRTLALHALIGTGIPDAFGVSRYKIESDSRPGHYHSVAVRRGTCEVTCTCENFQRRNAGTSVHVCSAFVCKHIAAHRYRLIVAALFPSDALWAVVEGDRKGGFLVSYLHKGEEIYPADAGDAVRIREIVDGFRETFERERKGLVFDLTGGGF